MSMTGRLKLMVIVWFTIFSMAAQADWALNNDESSFYYVTSKAAAITEVNHFSEISGAIDDSGQATLTIDLASVNTLVEIRDERMREILFSVKDFPEAVVRLAVDTSVLKSMPAGSTMTGEYMLELAIHGMEQQFSAELITTKLESGGLLIHNSKPVVINALSYGLGEGVEALREVAGLPSINNNVVVNFSLRFNETM